MSLLVLLLIVLAILAIFGGVYLSPLIWILLLIVVAAALFGWRGGWY